MGQQAWALDRFLVLINGPTDDPADNIILKIKQARESVLKGLVPQNEKTKTSGEGKAVNVVDAVNVHLVGGDPFFGHIKFDKKSYLVKELSPYKDEIQIDELSFKKWKEYAKICGKILSQTHARSDKDTGVMKGNAEEKILRSIEPALFVDDMLSFAETAYKRIKRDHELFKMDHSLKAFQFMGS